MYFVILFLLSPIFAFTSFRIEYAKRYNIPKNTILYGKKKIEMENKRNITKTDIDLFLERIKIKEKDIKEDIWDSGEVEWEF